MTLHTTGTTTPDGVHTLAPGLGERRPMEPPSGGHFKLPEGFPGAQQAQPAPALQQPQQPQPPQQPAPVSAPAPMMLPPAPPAPAGYQSAPQQLPPGMLVPQQPVHSMQHVPAPQPGMQAQVHAGAWPTALPWQAQQPPTTAAPQPWQQPQVPGHGAPSTAVPLQPQQPVAPGTFHVTVSLSGERAAVEAVLGSLMTRGVGVVVHGEFGAVPR